MGHSKELIAGIVELLVSDYPPNCGYQYVFEKRLKSKALGRSVMLPDIAIERDGCAVCVVEIGYTRPEKLTAYRETLRIPDVRWYGKDGTLHGASEKKTVSVSVAAEPPRVFSCFVGDSMPCTECCDGPRLVPGRCVERFIRRFGDEAFLHRQEEAEEAARCSVDTRLLTDYIAVWLPTECDKCGRTWLADGEDALDLIEVCREGPRAIARYLGAVREQLSWPEACAVVDGYGLSLNYMDGYFLRPSERAQIHIKARDLSEEKR